MKLHLFTECCVKGWSETEAFGRYLRAAGLEVDKKIHLIQKTASPEHWETVREMFGLPKYNVKPHVIIERNGKKDCIPVSVLEKEQCEIAENLLKEMKV